jgi:hypothetical protein
VTFLHLPIGETCSCEGELVYNYYKTFPFIIYVLASRVREATSSVRHTQLAVVRRKSTKLAASPPRGPATNLGQLSNKWRLVRVGKVGAAYPDFVKSINLFKLKCINKYNLITLKCNF